MDRPLIYLASPYTHDDAALMRVRYGQARHALGDLLDAGVVAYSPIVHSHGVSTLHGNDWPFWRGQCLNMLSRCDCLVALMLSGFGDSVGMGEEIKYAHDQYMPVVYWEREFIAPEQLAEQLACVRRQFIKSTEGTSTEPV